MSLFQPTWLGGQATTLFRQHHGGLLDGVTWTLPIDHLSATDRDHFRTVWTQSAHQEWCAAGAFIALQQALLLAGAPVDLIGASGRFVADEMLHVELACRMAMAYGGGAPLEIDSTAITPHTAEEDPLLRCAELALRVSCVGESFSLPLIVDELTSATDPLSRRVLRRIAKDEAGHGRFGWWVLDWALERGLSADERIRLAAVADDAIDALRPALQGDVTHHHRYNAILTDRIAGPLAARGLPLHQRSWSMG
ncbi:MAG: hypothetical protein ACI8RZ_004512 [Myxococcota bacterium]|jgi:hypothetical protein